MKPIIENDIKPIVESIFSLNLKMEILLTTMIGGFSFGAISGMVGNWIFDPAVSFYFLLLLIISDHITGITIAWKNNRFETRKAARIFWTLLAHSALLMFATNLSKGSEALYWLNEGIFVPLVIVNLLSLIKNLSLLGVVNKSFARMFYKKIDVYKNEYIEKNENKNVDVDHVGNNP